MKSTFSGDSAAIRLWQKRRRAIEMEKGFIFDFGLRGRFVR
jgi:hypothetical protein